MVSTKRRGDVVHFRLVETLQEQKGYNKSSISSMIIYCFVVEFFTYQYDVDAMQRITFCVIHVYSTRLRSRSIRWGSMSQVDDDKHQSTIQPRSDLIPLRQ